MKANSSEIIKSIPIRIAVTLPRFVNNQKSSPLYEIHTQLNYFNQSALYSVKFDHRYKDVSNQIQSLRLKLDNEKSLSQRLLLLHQLIKLQQQRKQLSISWDIFIEHQRWSNMLQKEAFWKYCKTRMIVGEEKTLEQLRQRYQQSAIYLNHNSSALQYAARHFLYCKQLILDAITQFPQISQHYNDQQKPALANYLRQCQTKLQCDHEALGWAMLQRITLALDNVKITKDPIAMLMSDLRSIGALDLSAKLFYGPQVSSTTRELAYFVQHILRHGNKTQIQALDQLMQTHQSTYFRFQGSVKQPVLLPSSLEHSYTQILHTKRTWAFVRKQCRSLMLSQRPLLSALVFMPKICLGEKLAAGVNAEALWNDLSALQKLLDDSPPTYTWQQTLLKFLHRGFRTYTQQWESYVIAQKLKLAQAQVNYFENILSGVWEELRQACIENPNQFALLESRMEICFQKIHQLNMSRLKPRQRDLLILLSDLKEAAERRKHEKQTFTRVRKNIEQLLSCSSLSEEAYYQLEDDLLSISPDDRNLIQMEYLHEDGLMSMLLKTYFTEMLFKKTDSKNASGHKLLHQCFGVMRNALINFKDSMVQELFYHAKREFKSALATGDITPENTLAVKNHLCECFQEEVYIKEIIVLPLLAEKIKQVPEKNLNLRETALNTGLLKRVETQLESSQRLLQQTQQLYLANPPERGFTNLSSDLDAQKIAKFLLQNLNGDQQTSCNILFEPNQAIHQHIIQVG